MALHHKARNEFTFDVFDFEYLEDGTFKVTDQQGIADDEYEVLSAAATGKHADTALAQVVAWMVEDDNRTLGNPSQDHLLPFSEDVAWKARQLVFERTNDLDALATLCEEILAIDAHESAAFARADR